MFSYSVFNNDINSWNVSIVRDMRSMFFQSVFNKDVSKWNVVKVENIFEIFDHCPVQKPYWYIQDKKLRQKIVKNYTEKKDLHQKLDSNLSCDKIIVKQRKIQDEKKGSSKPFL